MLTIDPSGGPVVTRHGNVYRFTLLCTLFLLASVGLEPFLGPLNRTTAAIAGEIIVAAGYPAQVSGDLIVVDGFPVRIVTECTSLYATLFLTAFILSWQASWHQRLAAIAAGGFFIGIVNALRIAVVAVIGSRDPFRFEIVHLYLGQVVMLLLVLGCCLEWRRRISGEPGVGGFLFRAACWGTILFLPWLTVHKTYLASIDTLVRWLFALLAPGWAITTPLPLPLYNHSFSIPLFLALMLASCGKSRSRMTMMSFAGLLALAAGHALFRTTHIVWSAFGITQIRPLHETIYLLGQLLLPVLLWLAAIRRGRGALPQILRGAQRGGAALALVVAIFPDEGWGGTNFRIYPDGRGSFVFLGNNLNHATAVGVTLSHDTLVQETPRVKGTGVAAQALLEVNTGDHGTLEFSLTAKPAYAATVGQTQRSDQVAISSITTGAGNSRGQPAAPRPAVTQPSSFSGTTTLATFVLPGPITNASGWVRNSQGGTESVVVTYANPPDGDWPQPRKGQSAAPAVPPARGAVSEPVVISLPQANPATNRATAYEKPSVPPVYHRLPAVSEQFMNTNVPRDAAALAGFIEQAASRQVRQVPALAPADGTTPLRLTVLTGAGEGEISVMALYGASVAEIMLTDGGDWQLDVLPAAGVCAVSITLRQGNSITEFPLTVAPPEHTPPVIDGCSQEFLATARGMLAQ